MATDIYEDYEAMSRAAATRFMETVDEKPDALISLATGSSPMRLYELLGEAVEDGRMKTDQLRLLALDEWYGLPRMHAATCAAFLEQYVLQAWGMAPEQVTTFHADADDPYDECVRIQRFLNDAGPINLCILGLGTNGHLGLNEPADALKPEVHVAELDERSQAHAMLKNTGVSVQRGMTIGLADILAADEIMMLITGTDKEEVYQYLLSGEINTRVPASFLHLHPNVSTFIDQGISVIS